ncbi:nucleotidyl transferase AbiEii/AbiGii toxin family protein [Conexibacter sp. JD483]|uniref:nucleotidyl transferase AbiEii/AbiGii toxin family protein n=1 Tax=unclassified Conexibacter TaxID=2627773 RepID=UPI00272888B3|nr:MULTISPECIES: nucleotidyl transferase AbiEii/AbiGii toxin family protein [unclassified Conexibacter]MDO8186046.1 nucleotidyl transferase AbiEii/AbiGii toxin family protein [Conexibacter sp. CPCC 205706]MDO8199536.1 nucleotidyl transferase AbiEii/AbiGii toxin family protein [Conexibacter sp. CPCC 205762]MDR9368929.1 nucleotidyl transferase AbiEii/AbiGii toxin family protein [Conexibacter sp. JD483]
MTAAISVDQVAVAAYHALRAKARAEHGGNTQPLLVVYAVESFLRRLAVSEYAERMVLKGGMLMAANSIRSMTRDADLSARRLPNDEEHVCAVVAAICEIEPEPHDGVAIDPASIRTEAMRAGDVYQGVRCKQVAALGRAQIPFALDLSFGDPTEATMIELESIIDRAPVRLAAYPLALNLAEKVVTAMQRRETNTRDRDFADLWVASRRHLDATDLRRHVLAIASHRGQQLIPLAEALADMPDRQQPYAAMVARMSYLTPPPERWSDLIADVVAFVDPLLVEGERQTRKLS